MMAQDFLDLLLLRHYSGSSFLLTLQDAPRPSSEQPHYLVYNPWKVETLPCDRKDSIVVNLSRRFHISPYLYPIGSGRTCLYFGARMADAPTYHVSPSPVHDLVHNHLFPGTTAQIDATQETLKHLQNAVHDVDADLVQMRTAFQHLLAKRAALQDYTDAHQRLVAPVHRLPTEILVGIFLHTLAAPWNLSAGGGRTLRPRPPSCGATSVWIFTNAIQTVIYLSRGSA